MNDELKNLIDKLYLACDALDNSSLDLARFYSNTSLREVLRFELLKFLLYLSALGGPITEPQAKFVKEYLKWDVDTEALRRMTVEYDIYSTYFKNTVPPSMRAFIEADNAIYENSEDSEVQISRLFLRLYTVLGENFLSCDGVITQKEQQGLKMYLDMLKSCAERELKSCQEPLDGSVYIK